MNSEKNLTGMKNKKITKARFIDLRYILFDTARILGIIPGLIWLRPKWRFESKKAKKFARGGVIFMFNHNGFADPIYDQFAIWYRRQHFVAAKELFNTKAKHVLFTIFKCIEIDRENFNISSFREITDHLRAGNAVSIFPEGHINGDDSGVAAFKTGIVMMAARSGSPVVPVYAKPQKKWYKRAVFCIGDPIDIKAECGPIPTMEQIEDVSDRFRKIEIKLKSMTEEKQK